MGCVAESGHRAAQRTVGMAEEAAPADAAAGPKRKEKIDWSQYVNTRSRHPRLLEVNTFSLLGGKSITTPEFLT